jgi:hypothetical protein
MQAVRKVSTPSLRPAIACRAVAYRLCLSWRSHLAQCNDHLLSSIQNATHHPQWPLGDSESRSRAGGLHYLGDLQDSYITNGSVICVSNLIPTACAAASESEYAADFINAREAEALRGTLADLGYAQSATTIICDIFCAIGIATNAIRHFVRSLAAAVLPSQQCPL